MFFFLYFYINKYRTSTVLSGFDVLVKRLKNVQSVDQSVDPPVSQSIDQSVSRSARQPVVQVAGRLGVLQQCFGDIIQILLVGQPIAGVHVITVRQQALHVRSDAARSALHPETDTNGSDEIKLFRLFRFFRSHLLLETRRFPLSYFLKMSSNRLEVSGRWRLSSSR